jgi:hypothetical protein
MNSHKTLFFFEFGVYDYVNNSHQSTMGNTRKESSTLVLSTLQQPVTGVGTRIEDKLFI